MWIHWGLRASKFIDILKEKKKHCILFHCWMGYPISKTQSQTQRNTTLVQQYQKYEYINPIIIIKPFKQQRPSSSFSEWGRGPLHLDFSLAWWIGHKFLFRQWKCDWISSYACHKFQKKSTTILFLKAQTELQSLIHPIFLQSCRS